MIESIEFTNFKALRQTTLPLAPFTLLLGPNGSGKSTVLQALTGIATIAARYAGIQRQNGEQEGLVWGPSLLSATAKDRTAAVAISLRLRLTKQLVVASFQWAPNTQPPIHMEYENGTGVPPPEAGIRLQWLAGMQIYHLDATAIAQPCQVNAGPLQQTGAGLVAVLDDLKDNHPERWESLLAEMRQWLPEYDHIQFDKPQQGSKYLHHADQEGRASHSGE